jgi:hypothetical protein
MRWMRSASAAGAPRDACSSSEAQVSESDLWHSAFPGHALRAPTFVGSDLGSGLPALAVLFDFSVLGELGKNAVEVVGSNSHLFGHLGDGDSGLALD